MRACGVQRGFGRAGQRRGSWTWIILLWGVAVSLLLWGCEPRGDSTISAPQATPSVQVERQAIDTLVQLYGQAVQAEDIDRLQALLQSDPVPVQNRGQPQSRVADQDADGTFATLAAFRQARTDTFQNRSLTALAVQDVTIAPDQSSVSFVEVESTLNPTTLDQQTNVFRTTFALARLEQAGAIRFRIARVTRQGPLVQVTTPGLLVAGPPMPVALHATTAAFHLAEVELQVPGSGAVQRATASGAEVNAHFTSPAGNQLHTLHVRAVGHGGNELVFAHRYRLHQAQAGVAQRIIGTATTRLFAVTVATDGTVWAGGDSGATLYRVAPGETTAERLERSSGRQTDLLSIFDLHDPRSPRLRGTVPLRVVIVEPSAPVGGFRGTGRRWLAASPTCPAVPWVCKWWTCAMPMRRVW